MKSITSSKSIKRCVGIGLFCIFAYVLLYIPNSMFGGYWGQPVSGQMEYSPGLSFHSLFLWQPYFGYNDSYNKSPMGLFFFPLIFIDQNYIHRPYDFMNEDDAKVLFSDKKGIKWHPKTEEQAKEAQLDKAIWRSRCVDDAEFCLESAAKPH